MKRLISLILTAAMLCTLLLTGASKPKSITISDNPTIGDALEIFKSLANMKSVYDKYETKPTINDALEILKKLAGMGIKVELPPQLPSNNSKPPTVNHAPKTFNSIEEFIAFAQTDETAIKNNVLANARMPKNVLPGFEFDKISHIKGSSSVDIYYKKTNYKYDNKFDEHDNYIMSTAAYTIRLLEFKDKNTQDLEKDEYVKNAYEQLNEWGVKRLNIKNRIIYHDFGYSRDGETLLCHGFDLFEDGKRVMAWLPAIDGMDEYDMVKYLDMETLA